MNFKWRIFLGLVAIVSLNTSSTAFASSSYVQHKVSSGKFAIRSACFMPASAQLVKVGVKGAERMPKESDDWAVALQVLVQTHLKADGIGINSATDPLSSGASDDEVRQVISQIDQKYNSVSPLMDKKPRAVAKSAYTLGDQVGMLPCSENSDILVFVQGAGQVLTGGRATMTFLVGGPAEGAILIVTMADAKTGEILGLVKIRPGMGFLDNAENAFGEGLDNELSDMNIGSARKNAREKGH